MISFQEAQFNCHLPTTQSLEERVELPSTPLEQAILVGEKQINKLRTVIRNSGTPYGQEFHWAFDHPAISDHGYHHFRHVEKMTKKCVRALAESRRDLFDFDNDITVAEDIAATIAFAHLHDLDQQLGNVWNLKPENTTKVKVKKGHGPGASVIGLATAGLYEDVNDLPQGAGFRIMAPFAIASFRHDEPERFDRTFSDNNQPAYYMTEIGPIAYTGDELMRLFNEDLIDMRTISPAQILEITTRIKSANGFMKDGSRKYGLSPSFEAEYEQQIEAVAADTMPVLGNISETRWERIKLLSEAVYFADMADMISPYNEQIMRTLLGQYSRERSFSFFHGSSEQPWGTFKTREERFAAAQRAVIDKGGNATCSDDTRLLWEMLHVQKISERSMFSELPMVKQFIKDHVVMSVLAMERMGPDIMNSSVSPIEKVYDYRLGKLHVTKQEIERRYKRQLNGEYDDKKRAIQAEATEVVQALFNEKKHKQYSTEDIEDHVALVSWVKEKILGMYKITPQELEMYQQLIDEGKDPDSLPYKNDCIPMEPIIV